MSWDRIPIFQLDGWLPSKEGYQVTAIYIDIKTGELVIEYEKVNK